MFKRLHLFCVVVFCLHLVSCKLNKELLVLKVEHTYDDLDGKKLFYNDLEICKYNEIKGSKFGELVIDDDKILIPNNSKLTLSNKLNDDLVVEILKGVNEINFKHGDTILWRKSHEEIDLEKTILVGDFMFIHNKDSLK